MDVVPDYPRVLAHRCGGALAPENTLAGLRVAARLGCKGVEFDTMLSADGVPVLIHDETLERTTDGHGRVAAHSLEALRRIDAGAHHEPRFRGEPIPTLADALDLCRSLGLWANVEIKPSRGRDEETGAVVGRLLDGQWDGRGLVSSFSMAAFAAARREAPRFDYALLSESIPADWRERLSASGGKAWHCRRDADPRLIRALADAGVPVACYTVNDRPTAERLFVAGAAAVFTDRPDLWTPAEM